MKKYSFRTTGMVLGACLLCATSCKKNTTPKAIRDFKQVNLAGNNNEYHNPVIDTMLVNAWGMVFNPVGMVLVASPGGHVTDIYDKEGNIQSAPINIPSPGGPQGGSPAGIVYNASNDFVLSNGYPAKYIIAGLDGVLSGQNGEVGHHALLIKNLVATSVFTGLTLATNNGANFLYAANFRTGKIDVWDGSFRAARMSFRDEKLPSGYSPFNIQAVGKWLYVAYAKAGPDGKALPGEGNGYVNVFTTGGELVKRFASNGSLNAPWGIVEAPARFFDDTDNGNKDKSVAENNTNTTFQKEQPLVLIGNFGDGKINAYTADGQFAGQLKAHGHTIAIPGLWSIGFAPATATTIDPDRLYFTAGPDHGADGLFGYLVKE